MKMADKNKSLNLLPIVIMVISLFHNYFRAFFRSIIVYGPKYCIYFLLYFLVLHKRIIRCDLDFKPTIFRLDSHRQKYGVESP